MKQRITLKEGTALLASRKASSREIVTALLERIESLDGSINSFITVQREELLRQAEESDRRRAAGAPLSPCDGIPVAVKDNIITRNVRTTCGSRILEHFVPPFDAAVCRRLAGAGLLLLGKTNMDEFAMGSSTETSFFGPTRNPYDRERVPGGSSGGSAAAVAAAMAPAALGSDTGGSIRQPAAFCGVSGIKPTYGRVSRYGLVAYASSLDQIGTFGATVEDAALLLSLICGGDPGDSTSVERPVDFMPEDLTGELKGMRIGVPEEYFQGVSAEIVERIRERIGRLEKRGAVIVPISLRYTEYAIPVYYLIATAEASSNLARYDGVRYGYRDGEARSLTELYTLSRSRGFGKEIKRRIILGTFSLSSGYYDAYYLKALKGRRLIIDDFRRAFESADVIVAPVTTTTAFKIGEMIDDPLQMYMSDILTISANLAGIPAMSVPAGLSSSGLPVGMQVMGDHFREKVILNVARAIEEDGEPIAPRL
ncbi:MAG: Asp-tRNA(Asn)/Glu-tRNA(Gln) amidotransferase subunit GatA [Spirochaetes bacterium]|nr:Asp-tRNA(Asn)/Glu-tRNA(Gln) amidotransferase subunit GatA [Spirochaetota bacterium]